MLEVIVALLSALLAYIVGRAQGRNQTRFEKQAEVAGKIMDLLRAIEHDIERMAQHEHCADRGDFSQCVSNRFEELVGFGSANAFWLPPTLDYDMRHVVGQFWSVVKHLQMDKGQGDLKSNTVIFPSAMAEVQNIEITQQMARIEDYTEKLLGHRITFWKAIPLSLWESTKLAQRTSEYIGPPQRTDRPYRHR